MNYAGLNGPTTPEFVRLNALRGSIPALVFLVSIPIAFIDNELAKLFWIAIWPANLAVEKRYGKEAYGTS